MNKFKHKLRSIAAVALILGVWGCQKDESNVISDDSIEINKHETHGSTLVLGKQKENPYSVENMKKAYQNLTSSGRMADFDIQTTDLYVRFLPADSLEYEKLIADTSLILWDYPLDYEVEVIGDYYHDPTIAEDLPTYQYTVVKTDFNFPDIQYEILAELFLPEDDSVSSSGRISSSFMDALEYEALRITSNLDEESASNGRIAASNWTPSGTVSVREVIGSTPVVDAFNKRVYLPVVNVKVKAKAWFYLSDTYTDINGNYRLKSTKRKVDYKIEFESDRVKVTDFLGWSRNYNGYTNTTSSWSPKFEYRSESWANATVLNAAYECRKQVNRYNIQTPFPETFWAGGDGNAVNKLNIRTKFAEGTGDMFVPRPNEIRIWTDLTEGRGQKGTDALYAVTFHELGHSIHFKLTNWNLLWSTGIIKESWAEYIEWVFTEEYYPGFANDHQADHWDDYVWDKTGGEDKEEKDSWKYTALFIDLVDNNPQPSTTTRIRPIDNVSGYTINQLEAALKNSRQLEHLRDYLKNNYVNATRPNLDALFKFYIDLAENKKE